MAIFTGRHLCWSLFLIKLQAVCTPIGPESNIVHGKNLERKSWTKISQGKWAQIEVVAGSIVEGLRKILQKSQKNFWMEVSLGCESLWVWNFFKKSFRNMSLPENFARNFSKDLFYRTSLEHCFLTLFRSCFLGIKHCRRLELTTLYIFWSIRSISLETSTVIIQHYRN